MPISCKFLSYAKKKNATVWKNTKNIKAVVSQFCPISR